VTLDDVVGACLSFGDRFFTVSDVAEALGGPRADVRHRLWKLEREGLLTRVRYHRTPPTHQKGRPAKDIEYRSRKALRVRAGVGPAQDATGWDKLWKAARISRRFSAAGLAGITGEKRENVRAFLKAYRKAGWMKPAREGGPEVPWVFIKNPPVQRPHYGGKGGRDE
jgi:hypothetical protein